MGESFARRQARRFAHLQDIAYDHVTAPDLIRDVRPDIFVHEFACRASQAGASIAQGQRCRLQLDSGGAILVCCGNQVLGIVDEADQVQVAEILANAGGQADCSVTRPSMLTQCFAVKLDEREDGDGGE